MNGTASLRRSLLLLGLLLCAVAAQAQQQVVEVITLGYRQADDVMPLLRPLLAAGGALTGTGTRLIVRTTPANLTELKQVLAVVDARPRQLVISVRQGGSSNSTRDRTSVSGSISAGGNGRITVPAPAGATRDPGAVVQTDQSRVEVRGSNNQQTQDSDVTQTVRVLEGSSAFIRVGQSVPVASTQINRVPGGTRVTQSTDFADADTGFYVTPRVNGDRVTLEIGTAHDQVRKRGSGAVSIQRANTVVSGRLGEWIPVAGVSESADRARSEALSQSQYSTGNERALQLKVDEVR